MAPATQLPAWPGAAMPVVRGSAGGLPPLGTLVGNQSIVCTTNKQLQQTPTSNFQWTLQLLVSDARTDCTGSLIRTRFARRGYRLALFSDAQGTPSLRIRAGQRGQGTRTSAARRGSVVAAASIAWKHRGLVARCRIGSVEMAYSGGDRSHSKGHA